MDAIGRPRIVTAVDVPMSAPTAPYGISADELETRQLAAQADAFPAIHSEVFHTDAGTPYLRHAGVVLIAKPQVELEGMRPFLEGFGDELDFAQYLDDPTR